MSAIIDHTATLSLIAKLEADLAKLKISLGATDVIVPAKARKSKAAPKADGEKKPPNAWIVFTQKVNGALKGAEIATGAAPVSKQFASHLKDVKAYDEWTDESIVAAWATWEKPEQSKMAKEKAATASEASASDSEATGEKKERKKREPMTDEAKAAMKAKRAATVAAKKGEAPAAAALPASTASSDSEEAAPVAAPPAPQTKKSKAFSKKETKKSETAAKTYSDAELQDFVATEPKNTGGFDGGINARGDLVDSDGNYAGHWDAETKKLTLGGPIPADWARCMPE
jgi:hypothetical protein